VISDNDFYSFLKCFHLLGYDLGKEVGVVLSLLHSHISQFNRRNPQHIWSRIVDIVQAWNQEAGTITPENLPEDLIEEFKRPEIVHIPEGLTAAVQTEPEETDWNGHPNASYLALANLVGAWNGNNDNDTTVLHQLTGENYSAWVKKAVDMLNLPGSPFSLKNGRWKLTERTDLWNSLGSRILDQN